MTSERDGEIEVWCANSHFNAFWGVNKWEMKNVFFDMCVNIVWINQWSPFSLKLLRNFQLDKQSTFVCLVVFFAASNNRYQKQCWVSKVKYLAFHFWMSTKTRLYTGLLLVCCYITIIIYKASLPRNHFPFWQCLFSCQFSYPIANAVLKIYFVFYFSCVYISSRLGIYTQEDIKTYMRGT